MFICTPPIVRLWIILALPGPESGDGKFPYRRQYMSREGGVTARHLLEAAELCGPLVTIHSLWPRGLCYWATEQAQERVRLWEVGAPCKKVLRDKALREQEIIEQEVRERELKQREAKARKIKEKALAEKELKQLEVKEMRVKEAERRDRKLKEAEFKATIGSDQTGSHVDEAKESRHRRTAPHTLAKCLISGEGRVKAQPNQSSDSRGFTFGA